MYNKITACKPYKKPEAQKWKEMFYDKNKKLQKEFESFWVDLQKYEEEEDGDDLEETGGLISANKGPSSNPNAQSSAEKLPTQPTPSAATKLAVQRGDRTAKMNALNDWISQCWEGQEEAVRTQVLTELESEHKKAMALWESRKKWSGTPLDFVRLVFDVSRLERFSHCILELKLRCMSLQETCWTPLHP
jgi:hypothetical protein